MIININGGNGGGGGGSYTLPIASSNTLGGVKVGSGLTIDSGGTMSVSGGSVGYNVVSSLPASANNGELFFIPAHSAETQYNVYIFNCSNWGEIEGYVLPSGGLNGKSLYYVPGDNWFHWDWGENENIWKKIEGWGWYKVDRENHAFYAAFTEEFTFNNVDPQAQLTTGTTAFTETFDNETYRYIGSAFTKEENIFYFGDNNFNRLMSLKENGFDLSQLTYVFDGLHGVFDNYDSQNNKFNFRLADLTHDPVGTPLLEKNRWLGVTEYSTDVENFASVPLPMTVEIDLSSSGLSSGLWVRTVSGDLTWGGNPIVLMGRNSNYDAEIWSQNVWFRPFYDADNNAWENLSPSRGDGYDGCKIFGSEFYYRGKKIIAEWLVNGEGSSTLMNWNETALSTADSTPPSA